MVKFKNILREQNLTGRKSKPLVSAITKRNPVTFYYSGPKEKVKRGVRIRAELVAMGLSKKGNLIVRAYIQPPSTSKKGYDETNWRTFIVDRMSNINIIEDETFDDQRPGYKEGSESEKGPMVVTYVTADWDKTKKVVEPTEPEPVPTNTPTQDLPEPEPIEKPEEVPTDTDDLPQPKPKEEPPVLPTQGQEKNYVGDVLGKLKTIAKDVNGVKTITTQDFQNAVTDLYKLKEKDWVNAQRELGKNTNPGEGTRKKFEVLSNKELGNELSYNKIVVSDKIEIPEPIQESIFRIKSLMLKLN